MAKKVILKDQDNVEILPITRGELIVDSSGKEAFHSNEFLATNSQPGLMSPEEKTKLSTMSGNIIDSTLSTTSTNPVQNKVVTVAINETKQLANDAQKTATEASENISKVQQIINSIKANYLKSATVNGNVLTIVDQSDSEITFTNTTYNTFLKETAANTGGRNGLVPKPNYNDGSKTRFLREDGTWVIPTNTSYTFANGTDGSFTVTPSGGSGQKVTIGKPATAGTADKVSKTLTIKINAGTTEGTDLYTYDGSKAKTLDIKAGANITLTPTAGVLTISATNSNTTYTLSGALDGNTFVTTLTPSSGTATTAVIPAMVGATSSAAGKVGLVPAPAANKHTSFLRGDGVWIIPTDTKNTAGSTNSTSKLFLIGATSQADNLQTYSNKSVYTTNGTLYATTFVGNLDGTYVNKLTGYKIAEAIGSIAATDSLNTALGKLEFKTDFIYNDLFGTDNDDVINKWHEIVNFVDSVAEGTDITDEFVTRKTTQTITGLKTFQSDSSTTGVSLILKNIGWTSNMSTAIDFYNGRAYTVPNARIETKMVGNGNAGGTLIFYTQTKHASTNPNPNGLTERLRIDDNGTTKITGVLTVTSNTTAAKFITSGGTSSQFVKGDGSLDGNTYATTTQLGQYLPLSGGTMNLGEGLKFHADNNYFGTNADARIISLLDGNDTICDGGLIIDERATSGGVEYVTELLRIRHEQFLWKGNTIWHAGNDGSGSGLDADLLDGKHASDFATAGHTHTYINNNFGGTGITNVPFTEKQFEYGILTGDSSNPTDVKAFDNYCQIEYINLPWLNSNFGGQIMLGANSGKIGYRTRHNGNWNQIKEILHQLNYTDYTVKKDGTGASGTWNISITGNAATATKLQTAITIWGQSFDGTRNIDGRFKQSLSTTTGNVESFIIETNDIDTNWGVTNFKVKTTASSAESDSFYTTLLSLNARNGGNVGIGTTVPAAKIEVNSSNNSLIWQEILRNSYNQDNTGYGVGLKLKLSSDAATYEVNKWGGIAYVATSGYANYGALVFYSGSANYTPAERMRIADNGNVLIGTTNDSGTKLQVMDVTRRGDIATQIKTSALVEIGAIAPGNDALYIGQLRNSTIWLQSAYGGDGSSPSSKYPYSLVLNPIGGNVGIGTTSPSYKLDVNGSIHSRHFYMGGYLHMQFDGSWLSTIDNDGTGPIFGYQLAATNRRVYYTGSPVYICGGAYNNYNSGITVNSSNNVGIGTTSPSAKLHVVGDVYTTTGFKKNGSSDSYILLGGGGHKALSDFSMAHNHPYLPLAGGWMDYAGQIYFKGLNQSTTTYATIGYRAGLGSVMHHQSTPYQDNGAFYIGTNGCNSSNDWGGLAIDNEGVTVFGAGDTGSVFRVLNEDNVSDGAQFYVTKSSGAVVKRSLSANNFISNISTGTQPYACTSTTCNTNLNADLLDGYHGSRYTSALGSPNNVTFVVGGNANTYYPVVINNVSDYYPMQLVNISRGYAETAPDTWYTSTHRGGLTLTLLWNGSRYWDGNTSGAACYCVYHTESYSTMVGGLGNAVGGKVVWLRGGGAVYHIHSMNGTSTTATVYTSTYTDAAGRSFAPKTSPEEVSVRWPGYAQGADYATSAGNADTVDGQHFSYSNDSNSPTYLWATNSNGSSFLAARGSISVNYANSAGSAGSAGYTTRLYANSTGDLITYPGDYSLAYSRFQAGASNIFPVSSNANGVITAHLHSGNYFAQIGLSSNGRMYYRAMMNAALNAGVGWNTVAWTSDIPTSLPANGGTSSAVTINYNNDSNSTYQMLWGSGNYVYGTGGIYCNPYTDYLYAKGFYHTGYGSSAYALTSDGGAAHIGSMSVNYANYAAYLPTCYIGGQKTNPQIYFNNTIGLRVAMTGSWSVWSDTLWINGYSGGDVKSMCALHFLRNGTPRMAISCQNHDATSYGTYYEVITGYNIGSQSVSYATSAGDADTVDGYHASGLFTNLSNSGNNISVTVGGTNKTLTVGYADKSGFVNLVNSSSATNLLMSDADGYTTVKRLTGTVGEYDNPIYISNGIPTAVSSIKLKQYGFMFGYQTLPLDSITLTVQQVRSNQLFIVGSGKTVTLPTPSDSLVGMVLFFKSATGASYSVSCASTNLVYHNDPMSTTCKTISISSNGSAIFVCMKYGTYCRWVLFWCG